METALEPSSVDDINNDPPSYSNEDPSDAHAKFVEILNRNLSASGIARVCQEAYRLASDHEIIFQLILDFMKDTHLPNRVNVLYVVDKILKHAGKYRFDGYITIAKANMTLLLNLALDCTITEGGHVLTRPTNEGYANLRSVSRVFEIWKNKGLVSEEKWVKFEPLLNEWIEKAPVIEEKSAPLPIPLTKEGIMKRMEEDRERKKREREMAWIRDTMNVTEHGNLPNPDPEFEEAWSKGHGITRQDEEIMEHMYKKWMYSFYDRSLQEQELFGSPNGPTPSSQPSSVPHTPRHHIPPVHHPHHVSY